MSIRNLLSMFVVGSMLAVAAAPAHADECKKVDFSVKNGKKATIRALAMEYKFSGDNTWRKESFPNVDVAGGAYKVIAVNQNLAGGESNKLVGLKLHFKAFCGGKWSKEFISAEDKTFDDSSQCQSNSNRSYRLDLSENDVCD